MSALSPGGKPLLVLEQGNLFGGVDLVIPGRRKPRRQLAVDGRFKVGFAAALALVVEHGRQAEASSSVPAETRCPRCGRVGTTGREFGIRVIRGKRVPQSWCRDCRAAHVERVAPEQLALIASAR